MNKHVIKRIGFLPALALIVALIILGLDTYTQKPGFYQAFLPRLERKLGIRLHPLRAHDDAHYNFHMVSPGVWRSNQPDEAFILRLKERGLKTIINLRSDPSVDQWERELAYRSDIAYYNFPMSADGPQDTEQLRLILRLMHNPALQPVLIHCAYGKDRTGLVIALYSRQYMNATFDEAHQDMIACGYNEENFPHLRQIVASWKTE